MTIFSGVSPVRDYIKLPTEFMILMVGIILWVKRTSWEGVWNNRIFIILSGLIVWSSFSDLIAHTFSIQILATNVALCTYLFMTAAGAWHWSFIVRICALVPLIAIIEYAYIGHFFFNNVAGYMALALIALPCTVYLTYCCFRRGKRIHTGSWLVLASIYLYFIGFSGSRAGWVALFAEIFVLIVIVLYRRNGWTARKLWGSVCIIILIIISIAFPLYFVRPHSVDGRLTIYEASWNMFLASPLYGHGSFGFLREYMTEQATLLQTINNESRNWLADNPYRTFNAPLSVLVHGGVVEFLLILMLLRCIWLHVKLLPLLRCGVVSSIGLGIFLFSLFSYPFEYPIVLLLLVLFMGVSFSRIHKKDSALQMKTFEKVLSRLLGSGLIVIALWYAYHESCWYHAAQNMEKGNQQRALAVYNKLLSPLQSNPLFIYNYAAELNALERYEESERVRKLAENYLCDYDTELLAGDNALWLRHYDEAEKHLTIAHCMIPNRFMPLFGLLQVYDMIDLNKADSVARAIVNKPIKVNSVEIEHIVIVAEDWLSTGMPIN